MDTFSTERLLSGSSDDDSDVDLVTDFLSSNNKNDNNANTSSSSSSATGSTTITKSPPSGVTATPSTTGKSINSAINTQLQQNSLFLNYNNNKSPLPNSESTGSCNNIDGGGDNNKILEPQNHYQHHHHHHHHHHQHQQQQQQNHQQVPSLNQEPPNRRQRSLNPFLVKDEGGEYSNNIQPSSEGIPPSSPSIVNSSNSSTSAPINLTGTNTNNNSNMVPIISVTPHSPGAKYNSILEDTLNQLQNIRESVVQMKNSTAQMQSYANTGLINSAVLSSSRLFSSCPSLPDLTAVNLGCGMWSPHQYNNVNSDRRKSWTAIEDLTDCTKGSHKSVSLSSLDSEESIRAAERHRSSRNSTGGISTHSLNEAELARDFERIAAKRNLTPALITRIPLQKSISTPSIAPLRIPSAKEENNISTTRHLSDSEDDNHDDKSLLYVRDKIEVYVDHPEKRRKRGSLFFRKKKDKTKSKGQATTTCDACGTVVNTSALKDHTLECKALSRNSSSKSQSSKSGSGKKNSNNSHTSHDDGRDYYDGHSQNEHLHYSDETPLIRVEFLNEPPIGPQDLDADPELRIDSDEPDSWSPSVPKEIVKHMKDKQVKRQEHIYEFIMTEKHHCQTLLVMQKVFVESLQKHFSRLNIDRMFPRLPDLTELHTDFLRRLRQKQRENPVVDSIADILLHFFSVKGPKLKNAYGEFCSNYRSAHEKFKYCMTSDHTFTEWHKHCLANPLLKKKGIPECILFVTQRLTKYPLLIDPLLKSSREDKEEQRKLQEAMTLVKQILVAVDACVAEKEKQDRQLEIFKCIDVKSYAIYKNKQFRKSDIGVGTNRKLKFEGYATLMQSRTKMQNVLVVVLSDCLFFLQESSHNKYSFFTPENKAGVVSLQKLIIREKAGTENKIYIISSDPAFPEMYELKVQNPKDRNVWIQAIREAVNTCPSDDLELDDLRIEEKQRLLDAKQATMRDVISKMRQIDIDQAILLEEKIRLQLTMLKEKKSSSITSENSTIQAEEFLANFGTYKDLVTNDCDTIEIWKRVLNTVQDISHLASSLYTAATGLPVSRSVSSVGEKHSEAYSSPTLPKRAETFGGFDEKRIKNNIPWRDAVLSTLPMAPMANKDNHHSHQHHQLHGNELIKHIASSDHHDSSISRGVSEIRENNYAALQVSHHLHTLLCIISQQMTTIHHLQIQLSNYRDNPKTFYKHNDQLEELRNLQDKLQEEKQSWLKQKEQQERELEEQRTAQEMLQKQIKAEQEDIKQQREQLYRKMEILSSQGLLLSPNTPLPIATNVLPTSSDETHNVNLDEHHQSVNITNSDGTLTDRRKDKWKSASIPKTPPVNLLSATNAPKVNQASVKQQIPMKLSSLSSTKIDKTPPSNAVTNSPILNPSGVITQMLPLKLADKKNQNLTPNHSRTGSSPAVIQQPTQQQSGNPATRTNTYPKLPERYRVRTSDVGLPTSYHVTPHHIINPSSSGQFPSSMNMLANISGTHHQQHQQQQQNRAQMQHYTTQNSSLCGTPVMSQKFPSTTSTSVGGNTALTTVSAGVTSTTASTSSLVPTTTGDMKSSQNSSQASLPPDEEEIYF